MNITAPAFKAGAVMQPVNSFISSTVVGDSLRLKNQGLPVSGLSFALFAKGADAWKPYVFFHTDGINWYTIGEYEFVRWDFTEKVLDSDPYYTRGFW